MLKELKRLSSSSAVYGVGNFIERMLSFLLLPLYTSLLNPAEYGTNALLFSSIAFCNVMFAYGLDSAFLRYFILAKEENDKKEYFSTSVISILITSVLFSMIILALAVPLNQFMEGGKFTPWLIRLCAIILFFDVLSSFGFLVLRAEERAKQYTSLKIVKTGVILGLNVLFVVVFKWGVFGILLATAIGSVVSLLTVIPVYIHHFTLTFNKSYYKELLKFGMPYVFPGISIIIMELIDRYFLSHYIGFEMQGIYSASYKIAMIMALLVAAFRSAWHPFFLSIKDQSDCKLIYARILTYYMLISSVLFLGISFFMNDIVDIIPILGVAQAEEYKRGLVVLPYILGAHLLNGVYVNFIIGIYLKKKSHFLPYIVGSAAIANIIGNYFLIPVMGMTGAALTTTVSYFLMVVAMYLVSRRIYPIEYEWRRIFKIVIITLLMFFLPAILNRQGSLPLEILAFILYPVLLLAAGFFRPDELNKIKSIFRKKKK